MAYQEVCGSSTPAPVLVCVLKGDTLLTAPWSVESLNARTASDSSACLGKTDKHTRFPHSGTEKDTEARAAPTEGGLHQAARTELPAQTKTSGKDWVKEKLLDHSLTTTAR